MKKTALLLLLTLTTLVVSAQNTWYSNYNRIADWNEYTKEWTTVSESDDVIEIVFSGHIVVVNAKTPTKYYTYGSSTTKSTDESTSTKWQCYFYRNGAKRYGDFKMIFYADKTLELVIFYWNGGVYRAISYMIEKY